MKKIVLLILFIICIAILPVYSESIYKVFSPFDSGLSGAGIIFEATGMSLVIGAGLTTSLDLRAGLIMMQIAPVFSATGAWCTHVFMEKTSKEWEAKGLDFNAESYIRKSRNAAIGTTVFAAGALLTPLIPDAGPYISLGCTAVAVIWDIIALYGPRLSWYKEINAIIFESGLSS